MLTLINGSLWLRGVAWQVIASPVKDGFVGIHMCGLVGEAVCSGLSSSGG